MTALYPSVLKLPHVDQPSDGELTRTLEDQQDTEDVLAEVLYEVQANANPEAEYLKLAKLQHIQYMAANFGKLSAGFVALDASRPWLAFWTLQSLDLIGVPLDSNTKRRAVNTILAFLHPTGGFCGGPANTQIPHLLPNYASVCVLAQTGSAEPGGGWDKLADARQNMYDFFMRCKQPNGGFVVSDGGEIDVRGTYCLLVVATLLDILTPELLHNIDQFIAGCQTYEGGFACSSWAFDSGRAAMAEAHGGYTSCSLFSHFLLASVVPPEGLESLGASFPRAIDVASAVRWSVLMQGEASEVGGFRGRTNKLVDGCYGWWVGGGFPVLEELHHRETEAKAEAGAAAKAKDKTVVDDENEWADEESMKHMFNRVALQEYVLLAAQADKGGLRDKPGKRPDLYHTCNNLCGLSIAQNRMNHSSAKIAENRAAFDMAKGRPAVKPTTPGGGWKSEDERQRARREAFANVLGWVEDENAQLVVGGADNRLNATTPVINLIRSRLEPFVKYMYGQV